MNETTVVNLYAEPYDVYIGRKRKGGTNLGNPFEIGKDGTRTEVIEKYKSYFYERLGQEPAFKREIEALQGKRLGCFCKPSACHGDVIKEYLDSL